jgi:hypothetical protein
MTWLKRLLDKVDIPQVKVDGVLMSSFFIDEPV